MDRYEELVKTVYCEPGDPQILVSIFGDEISPLLQRAGVNVANVQTSWEWKKMENCGHLRHVMTTSYKQPTLSMKKWQELIFTKRKDSEIFASSCLNK